MFFSQKQPNQTATDTAGKPADTKTTPLPGTPVTTTSPTTSVPDTPTTDIKPPLGSISADIKDNSASKDDKVRNLKVLDNVKIQIIFWVLKFDILEMQQKVFALILL